MDATPTTRCAAIPSAHRVKRFPTPRPPLDSCRTAAPLDEGRHSGDHQAATVLKEIKAVVTESKRNRRCVEMWRQHGLAGHLLCT
jgi:hypothetical protein